MDESLSFKLELELQSDCRCDVTIRSSDDASGALVFAGGLSALTMVISPSAITQSGGPA